MTSSARQQVIEQVVTHLVARRPSHPLRVAVDGITGVGKSTLATELTTAIQALGREAVQLSTDDFHHPSAHRRRNPDPARGYYDDAFDLTSFRRLVLDPLGPGGDRRYRARLHDLSTDRPVDEPADLMPADAVLVVDGSFLQSRFLDAAWDEVIYLHASFDTAVERAVPRDTAMFGSAEAVREAYAARYHRACRLYLDDVGPREGATIVVDNDDIDRPDVWFQPAMARSVSPSRR